MVARVWYLPCYLLVGETESPRVYKEAQRVMWAARVRVVARGGSLVWLEVRVSWLLG